MVGLQSRSLTTSLTLPTPRNAWNGYCNALERHPLRVKAATAAVGFTLGDIIAQLCTRPPQGVQWRFDTLRCMRLAVYGGAIGGPIGHHWFGFLDRVIMPHNPKSVQAVVTKIGLDQMIMCPIGTTIFYTFAKLMDGFQTHAVIPTVQEKLVPTVLASYRMWPLAHAVNFALVPPSQRILYTNVVAIAWTCILSRMAANQGVAPELAAGALPEPVISLVPVGEDLFPATATQELVEEMQQEALALAEQRKSWWRKLVRR